MKNLAANAARLKECSPSNVIPILLLKFAGFYLPFTSHSKSSEIRIKPGFFSIFTLSFWLPRVNYRGSSHYRKDFLSILKLIDLFMNPKHPKRNGGAGGATRAMRTGIPVTTLPDNDVASSFAGDDFICADYDEMIADTLHYISDPEYYKSQSEKAKGHFKTLFSTNVKDDLQTVIDKILEIAKTQ